MANRRIPPRIEPISRIWLGPWLCSSMTADRSAKPWKNMRRKRKIATTSSTPRTMPSWASRSEEHTSELQSHLNLVCRLLLEKKKNSTESHEHAVTALQHVRY